MVSILGVAEKAKVSRMTVTRVLRSEEGVSPDTRERVIRVMRELGYVPSTAARAMRSKDRLRRSGALCVGLVFGADTQVADGFFCEVARGAEKEAAENGLCLLQVHGQESLEKSWPRLQSVFAISGLCGVILAGEFLEGEITSIRQMTHQVVVLDRPACGLAGIASVESDNLGGCRMAVEHLLERGSRRLVVLTGREGHYFTVAMEEAVRSFQDRFEVVEVIHGDLTAGFGSRTVKQLWSEGRRFDAVFGNDETAIGAIRGFSEIGVAVPREVKVVGFDDVPHAEFTTPTLTSVNIDKSLLGREGVRALMELVRHSDGGGVIKKAVQARLMVRESTGGRKEEERNAV